MTSEFSISVLSNNRNQEPQNLIRKKKINEVEAVRFRRPEGMCDSWMESEFAFLFAGLCGVNLLSSASQSLIYIIISLK